jgi:hypothetical protein
MFVALASLLGGVPPHSSGGVALDTQEQGVYA